MKKVFLMITSFLANIDKVHDRVTAAYNVWGTVYGLALQLRGVAPAPVEPAAPAPVAVPFFRPAAAPVAAAAPVVDVAPAPAPPVLPDEAYQPAQAAEGGEPRE